MCDKTIKFNNINRMSTLLEQSKQIQCRFLTKNFIWTNHIFILLDVTWSEINLNHLIFYIVFLDQSYFWNTLFSKNVPYFYWLLLEPTQVRSKNVMALYFFTKVYILLTVLSATQVWSRYTSNSACKNDKVAFKSRSVR